MNIARCREIFGKFAQKKALIGFSGGADSTALLVLAEKFRAELSLQITAIIFNHHLRDAESDAEAADAQRFCRSRGIDCEVVDIAVPAGENLEAAARAARLAAWRKLAKKYDADTIFLGHHLDDRLENFFIRLGRGGNASGVTSLREITHYGELTLVRPLLDWQRREIEKFLHQNGIDSFAQDSSNQDESFTRNALRNRLLPELYRVLPGGKRGCIAALDALSEDAAFLESEAERYLASGDPDTLKFWQTLPPALLPRVLREYLCRETGVEIIVPGAGIRRLREALASSVRRTRQIPLCGKWKLALSPRGVCIVAPAPPEVVWEWQKKAEVTWGNFRFKAQIVTKLKPADESCAYFSIAGVPDQLIIAAPCPGCVITPFGRRTPVKIKKLRIDRKLPAFPVLPVVKTPDGVVIWAPLVRHGNFAPVAEPESPIIAIQMERI